MPCPALIQKPAIPKPQDYDKRLIANGATTRRRAANAAANAGADQDDDQASTTTVTGEQIDPNGKPANAREMTAAARAAFRDDMSFYTINLKEYESQQKKLTDLREWITGSVKPQIYQINCDPEESTRTWYTNLKVAMGGTNKETISKNLTAYKKAVKPMDKAPKDPIAWIAQWEHAISLALKNRDKEPY